MPQPSAQHRSHVSHEMDQEAKGFGTYGRRKTLVAQDGFVALNLGDDAIARRAVGSLVVAGGLGILIGDGRLPHYAAENILETYYSIPVSSWFTASADYQFIDDPAYNRIAARYP